MPVAPQLDVIAAYDRIAPRYESIRAQRKAYCDAIDRLIEANLRASATSLLDVGAGDGRRAEAIAQRAGIGNLILLEPSSGMRSLIHSAREIWPARIEVLPSTPRKFDVITCLWNVLGHVSSQDKRVLALRTMRDLLSPAGIIFLDVQNRYNARAYGVLPTLGRIIHDILHRSAANGDVTVHWENRDGEVLTYGHVFTLSEMTGLAGEADLKIQQLRFIDYATGELRASRFGGSIFLALTGDP
jgi:2-polyprenyl-3-methyl-5-hydroxy-6-metoxy-1,4-benzoquinol methylase